MIQTFQLFSKKIDLIIFCLITFLLLLIAQSLTAQELITYPAPAGVMYTQHNDDYTVRVRKPGGTWQDLFEYNVKVDLDKPQDASMVYFDFSGKVEIMVRKNNENFRSAQIRPAALNLKPEIVNNVITFSLTQPSKISVEFDGDKLHNLHLFANALETYKPNPNDPDVIYFGPGVHSPPDAPGDVYHIPSGKTVYIAGGAVVKAKLVVDKAQNVKILGRGILLQPERGIEITYSNNITIDGIIVVNPQHYTVYGGQSNNLIIRNLKSFSANPWSDGIDLMSCSDVVIDDIFMRNSDDCIAIYTHRWNFFGNARNYKITNAVLWADVAHPTNIGVHGNTTTSGDTIENVLFRNIDILEQDEDDPDYQGTMALSVGDLNLVRNIRYEDIRVADFQEGQLLSLRVFYNKKYNTGPGRRIENIYFKNINYKGNNDAISVINGLDKDHLVKGVTFENLRINGKKVLNAKDANISIGEFAQDIKFISSQ